VFGYLLVEETAVETADSTSANAAFESVRHSNRRYPIGAFSQLWCGTLSLKTETTFVEQGLDMLFVKIYCILKRHFQECSL
jgi:hypothetical protein